MTLNQLVTVCWHVHGTFDVHEAGDRLPTGSRSDVISPFCST